MVRLLFVWCAVFLFGNASVDAVTLRVETTQGDSAFFATDGDTVSVSVKVDSEGKILTGVEVFLAYDPRAFVPVESLRPSLIFGRVLIDTQRVLSDSVAVLHFAEADFVGKSVADVLFAVDFAVVSREPLSSFELLQNAPLYRSAYTTDSQTGQTFLFEHTHALTYADLPPVLSLPPVLPMTEDEISVVDLRPLALDAESGTALVWSISSQSDQILAVVTDTLSLVLTPADNFNGQVQLDVVVADGAGGQAQGELPVQVASVNDAPEWIAGVLPDSVVLTDRNARFSLRGAVKDVDGDDVLLAGQSVGDVGIEIDEQGEAQVFAALDWVGDVTLFVSASDGQGAGIAFPIRVIRREALNTLPGDFDGNGEVGFPDFLAFAQVFGQDNPSLEADLNGDARVDFADFLVFVQNFGRKS